MSYNIMEKEALRVMHIDLSHKFYERKDTGIAFKIVGSNIHKGMSLSIKLKREIEKKLNAKKEYAKLYAISIYYLIRDNLSDFDELIICGDEDPALVKKYLIFCFEKDNLFSSKVIKSIRELRIELGNKNIRSYADDVAYSYMRRALKSLTRRQVGTLLNVVKINYKMIAEKWEELDNKLKKQGGE